MKNRQGLRCPPDDEADPDGPLIGCARAAALGALLVRAPLAVLVAVTAAEGDHVPPPARAGAGADGGEGRLEADLDFEPPAPAADQAAGKETGAPGGPGAGD